MLVLVAVAPFTGAWIETALIARIEVTEKVAPFTGAWIETYMFESVTLALICRALHGRVD